MNKKKFDFGGWATKNDLLCADGRTIRKNAFKDDDGRTVPLVWQHNHEDPTRVIGHALLENRDEGVYAYCSFNGTDIAKHVKELVRHEDVNSLSIYANKLKQAGGDVLHGTIREVSVVLAGANPGAQIEFPIMEHGEESETEACIWPGEENLEFGDGLKIQHAEKEEPDKTEVSEEKSAAPVSKKEEPEEKDDPNETVQDVLNTLTPEQKQVVEFLVGKALEGDDTEESDDEAAHSYEDDDDLEHADEEGDGRTVADVLKTMTDKQRKVVEFLIAKAIDSRENGDGKEEDKDSDSKNEAKHSFEDEEEYTMKKNVFDNEQMNEQNDTLTHAQMETLIKDGKRLGSLKQSVLEHSAEYGIEQIDYLMPEYREVNGAAPQFIRNEFGWVDKVLRGVHRTPFSKIKTTFADITEEEARARGYIKGKLKKNEVFTLLKRTTDATTIYKKQKLDRDDVIEITSFDVIAWLKTEMRAMLDEELARAILIGDGRDTSSDDHINENNIRPVLRDADLYVVRKELTVAQNQEHGDALVDAVTYAWADYQGSGNCIAFMTRQQLAELRLLKDRMGRRMYNTEAEIASAFGVREIVAVPAMGDSTTVRVDADTEKTYKPAVIILDLNDYNIGADKGGAVNMFDDFDIDYNQMKYLIETRCSGALIKPYSAIVIEEEVNPS